jgi:1-deoxy-D-xylulose-5-phosphate synthase
MKEQYLGLKSRYRRLMERVPGGRGIYRVTKRLKDRVKRFLLPTTMFENMGLTYLGPVDGHDLPGLIAVLEIARDMGCPVLVHVVTKKGCGYLPAEQDPSRFHGIGKFDPGTGKNADASRTSFSDVFGETMVELAGKDRRICAITAAMPGGTGLLDFKKKYPDRLFDVGIAEEHAVSMAGGLAKQGMIPVVALYSTFLQRSYDQIIQDIALMKLHVVLAVDRAGLVGEDGATHHGVFDVGFLRQIPGIRILCPASMAEQKKMLSWAVECCTGPVAVRYPRGGDKSFTGCCWDPKEGDAPVCHRSGRDVTIITYGTLLQNALGAAEILAQSGIEASVLRLTSLSDLDISKILPHTAGNALLVLEEVSGGTGIAGELALKMGLVNPGVRVFSRDLGRNFVPHGSVSKLYEHCGLDERSIAEYIQEVLKK